MANVLKKFLDSFDTEFGAASPYPKPPKVEPAEPEEHTYWRVTARLLGGGDYPNDVRWTFGYDNPSESDEADAHRLADEVMGDGTGIYDGGKIKIRRETLVAVNVEPYTRNRPPNPQRGLGVRGV